MENPEWSDTKKENSEFEKESWFYGTVPLAGYPASPGRVPSSPSPPSSPSLTTSRFPLSDYLASPGIFAL